MKDFEVEAGIWNFVKRLLGSMLAGCFLQTRFPKSFHVSRPVYPMIKRLGRVFVLKH